MEKFFYYAPLIIAVFIFFIQFRVFVTPEQLERKHREVITECKLEFSPRTLVTELKERLDRMEEKIDKLLNNLTR